jgi:hypothetical protein
LLFPAPQGCYLDLHNFRNRNWKPAQQGAGIDPFRRIYDLRDTFATFALRAGISTFELSRYMGASLTMIDRTTGTSPATAASTRFTSSTSSTPPPWTLGGRCNTRATSEQVKGKRAEQAITRSPLTDSNRRPLLTIFAGKPRGSGLSVSARRVASQEAPRGRLVSRSLWLVAGARLSAAVAHHLAAVIVDLVALPRELADGERCATGRGRSDYEPLHCSAPFLG